MHFFCIGKLSGSHSFVDCTSQSNNSQTFHWWEFFARHLWQRGTIKGSSLWGYGERYKLASGSSFLSRNSAHFNAGNLYLLMPLLIAIFSSQAAAWKRDRQEIRQAWGVQWKYKGTNSIDRLHLLGAPDSLHAPDSSDAPDTLGALNTAGAPDALGAPDSSDAPD